MDCANVRGVDAKTLLVKADLALEDPRFYRHLFRTFVQEKKRVPKEALEQIAIEEYDRLSERLDQAAIQESCSVRNILRVRQLALLLINEEGALDEGRVAQAVSALRQSLYSLGPGRQFDAVRNEWMVAILERIQKDKELKKALHAISKPHQHRIADQLIRQTLQLVPEIAITDGHARAAALAALLCYLRQSVGSCFATAPAIIVHDEQPQQFLADIRELLGTGRMKRTFGGVEYVVPLSHNWGAGDLRRRVLLPTGPLSQSAPLWSSPGLIAALEEVEILEKESPYSKKVETLSSLMVSALALDKESQPFRVLSVERCLRMLLMAHFSLSEEELEEYSLRPHGMFQSRLMMQLPQTGMGERGKRCAQFLAAFERAKETFKGLADNALLKAWEYTVASFAETKAQFARWNLYSSLGLGPNEKGGIGPCLLEILESKLQVCNEEVKRYQDEYEQVHTQLLYLQRRIRRASTEQEAKWIQIEYQTKANQFNSLEEMRDRARYKAERFANLYNDLIAIYDTLFPHYFQEVYDPEMQTETDSFYDDSPAGFRLLYRHGRSNTAQWSLIYNPADFIEALVNFFTATETELVAQEQLQGLEDELGEIVTAIVNHVRSEEFLESAFHRMAIAHHAPLVRDPLHNLGKVEKKPWAYTSGGAMTTLVSCYFRREQPPTEVSRWVDDPMELFVFLVDSLKELPHKLLEEYDTNPGRSMLIHSPTHAFLLKPGHPTLRKAREAEVFTYTWLRDHYVTPRAAAVDQLFLHEEMMQYLIDRVAEQLPEQFRHYFTRSFSNVRGSMHVPLFRDYLLETIEMTPGLKWKGGAAIGEEQIDSALFSLLPLFPSYQLKERLEAIAKTLPGLTAKELGELLSLIEQYGGRVGAPPVISAKGLQEIAKALLIAIKGRTTTPYDYHLLVARAAQEKGFALPEPLIFADSNWVRDLFAFVVNPGTGKLELWRVDYTGSEGAPMVDWKMWLDGSRKEPTWGIYTRPHEYRLAPERSGGFVRY